MALEPEKQTRIAVEADVDAPAHSGAPVTSLGHGWLVVALGFAGLTMALLVFASDQVAGPAQPEQNRRARTPSQFEPLTVHEPTACRAAPASEAPVVTTLAPGTPLTATERDGAWARVASKDGDCWISNDRPS